MSEITPEQISRICSLVNELAGIQWDADKTYLIESRLSTLVQQYRLADFDDLVSRVRAGTDATLKTAFMDSITTRETLFFRDDSPFEALRHKALPEIFDAKQKTAFPRRLRIWSAACSSGQEPYSIGIVLHELLDDIDDWDIKILATDISPAAIETASRGYYTDFEMGRGIPEQIQSRYFERVKDGWKICDSVRSLVMFEPRNLLKPFTSMGPFDVIFCRNVAIYFELDVKIDLFNRLAEVLAPHGSLFVGSSESLSQLGDRWVPQNHCRGVFYQPHRQAPPPAALTRSKLPMPLPAVRTTTPNSVNTVVQSAPPVTAAPVSPATSSMPVTNSPAPAPVKLVAAAPEVKLSTLTQKSNVTDGAPTATKTLVQATVPKRELFGGIKSPSSAQADVPVKFVNSPKVINAPKESATVRSEMNRSDLKVTPVAPPGKQNVPNKVATASPKSLSAKSALIKAFFGSSRTSGPAASKVGPAVVKTSIKTGPKTNSFSGADAKSGPVTLKEGSPLKSTLGSPRTNLTKPVSTGTAATDDKRKVAPSKTLIPPKGTTGPVGRTTSNGVIHIYHLAASVFSMFRLGSKGVIATKTLVKNSAASTKPAQGRPKNEPAKKTGVHSVSTNRAATNSISSAPKVPVKSTSTASSKASRPLNAK